MSEEQLLVSRRVIPSVIVSDDREVPGLEPWTYSKVAILMHWVMAPLILLNLVVGFFMETFANPSPERSNVLFWHASIGTVILGLAMLRMVWRLTHQPPPLPKTISKMQQIAAHSVHWALYLLILVQPISGYVHRMAGAHPVSFFGLFNLPVWIGKNEPLRHLTDVVHDSGAIILAVLVVGHIGVALKHRFIDRDAVMERMTV